MKHAWRDIAGQTLFPLGPRVQINISAAPPAAPLPPDALSLWQQRCAANPRLHDGPILAARSLDAISGRIDCIPDRFQRLASQGAGIDLGVRLLGVKGLIIARDHAGAEHVLIARRGRQTRIYGDMWELAPAGGVDAPPEGVASLDEHDVIGAVLDEGREELAMTLDARAARVVAAVQDEVACSLDLIVRVDWPGVIDPRRAVCAAATCSWEYTDSAWLARKDAADLDRRSGQTIVGPMRAVLRWMNWTGEPGGEGRER
jgi:hypothetical protein